MGLLPSSRRKQSRDLGDSVADDIHVHLNGPGEGRPGRSRRQQYHVRLVRTRTLSGDLEGEGWAGTPDSGVIVGSLVLQNGGVKGEREVKKLLADTQPVARWQERLRRLLSGYILRDDAFHALAFLEKNMDTAIVAVEDPTQSQGYPALFIDIKHKPQVFDLQHWKDIMIALHFEITEPESNRDLDLVEVKVTRQVTLGSLLGFKFLLHCLSNITWDMLRMLLALNTNEAMCLLAVMQTPHGHHHGHGPADMSTLQGLFARYPQQLSALGFSLAKHKKSKVKDIIWHPQSSHSVHFLEMGLIGLFHNGSGLETYI